MGYKLDNSVGSRTTQQLQKIAFSGNIIPTTWYLTVVKTTPKRSPRPYLEALHILADVVYWYRPSEVRDETTGQLIGYKKKFKADLLQRSYKAYADMLGISKDMVRDAFDFLEETIGVLQRHFRSIPYANGGVARNVLFIELKVDRLLAITFPDKEAPAGTPVEIMTVSDEPGKFAARERQNFLPKDVKILSRQGEITHTNTETPSENSPETTTLVVAPEGATGDFDPSIELTYTDEPFEPETQKIKIPRHKTLDKLNDATGGRRIYFKDAAERALWNKLKKGIEQGTIPKEWIDHLCDFAAKAGYIPYGDLLKGLLNETKLNDWEQRRNHAAAKNYSGKSRLPAGQPATVAAGSVRAAWAAVAAKN